MVPKVVLIAMLIILAGITVEMKSFHRIGARVPGDRLIVTDTLHSPTMSESPQNHTISFRHPVTMVITSIDLYSDANVYAEFVLSYDSVLHGVITAVDALEFELTISVFGIDFKEVPNNFSSPLSPKTQYTGVLTADSEEEYLDLDYDSYDDEEEEHNDIGIEVMSIGERQPGDKLIFKDFQSSDGTDLPARHEVIFRFIDSFFMTHVEFKTFDKYNATAIFSHLTEHSIKAIIQAENATSLDVECKIFGYDPKEKPTTYRPLISSIHGSRQLKQVICNGQNKFWQNNNFILLASIILLNFRRLISSF